MSKETKVTLSYRPNKTALYGSLILVVTILFIFIVKQFSNTERSVTLYCQTYKAEKIRLDNLPGNTWSSGVFNNSVGRADEYAKSFGRLEKVAPAEIQPDVNILESTYKNIQKDSSQAVNASLSGISAENSVKNWTTGHCGN